MAEGTSGPSTEGQSAPEPIEQNPTAISRINKASSKSWDG